MEQGLEQTRVRTSEQECALPIHTAGAGQLEANQRAPTLMAGELAGSQGQVQVWSPEKSLMKKQVSRAAPAMAFHFLFPLPALLLLINGLDPVFRFHFLVAYLLLSPVWLGIGIYGLSQMGALPALRRPRYLTTDDAGIGITTLKGSRYLKWSEIAMVSAQVPDGMVIRLCSEESIFVNLAGYPAAKREELWDLLIRNCELAPLSSPGSRWTKSYARTGCRVSLATGQLLLPTSKALPGGGSTG